MEIIRNRPQTTGLRRSGSPAGCSSIRSHQPTAARGCARTALHFGPGVRTAWHTHPHGQVLHVTDGVGLVQRRGEAVQLIRVGDTAHRAG